MIFTNLRYQDTAKTGIAGNVDSVQFIAPVDSYLWNLAHNGDRENKVDPVNVDDFIAPSVDADQVRAEADRRIELVKKSHDLIALRGQRAGAKTKLKRDKEAASLKAAVAAIEDAEDVVLALSPLPVDFADDRHWPIS